MDKFTLTKLIDLIKTKDNKILRFYSENNNYKEIQLDDNGNDVESQVDNEEADRLTNYDSIDLDKEHTNNLNKNLERINSILERIKLCTEKIKYKLGILSNNILSVINRHNDVNHFLIKKPLIDVNKQEFIIVIDLENYYKKIDNINSDIRKIYVNLFQILNKVHNKEISNLYNILLNTGNQVKTLPQEYIKQQELLKLLNTTSSKI